MQKVELRIRDKRACECKMWERRTVDGMEVGDFVEWYCTSESLKHAVRVLYIRKSMIYIGEWTVNALIGNSRFV